MHWSGADCPVLVMKRCNARGAKGVGHSTGTQANGQPDEPDSTGRRQPSSSDTSRVKREFQARICERLRVQFPRPTRRQLAYYCHQRPSAGRHTTVEPQAAIVLRRRSQPHKLNKPKPSSTIEEDSGVAVTEPLSTNDTLSKPLVLSLDGFPFRNCRVVEALVAVNVAENSCHACVVVQPVQLFVKKPSDVPLTDKSTLLVTP